MKALKTNITSFINLLKHQYSYNFLCTRRHWPMFLVHVLSRRWPISPLCTASILQLVDSLMWLCIIEKYANVDLTNVLLSLTTVLVMQNLLVTQSSTLFFNSSFSHVDFKCPLMKIRLYPLQHFSTKIKLVHFIDEGGYYLTPS